MATNEPTLGCKRKPASAEVAGAEEDTGDDAPGTFLSRQEAVDRLLDKLQEHLLKEAVKGTVADYMKLLQIRKDFTDERPGEIEVTWVNSLEKESNDEQ